MDFTTFMGNLKTHEIEMKAREEREPPKKIVSLKLSSSRSKKNEDDNDNIPC